MSRVLSRREVLAAAVAFVSAARTASAEEIIDLDWEDLLPEGEKSVPNAMLGLLDHSGPDVSRQQPASTGVRTDWNGMTVRLPGYIVPIDYDGTGVSAFLLVPYVGACIHVPPPPANQLVLVTTQDPYETNGLFEAVNVTGMFGTASTRTQLAEVGYALSADRIEPFR